MISEEVCDMGSYRTRRQPSVIRASTWPAGSCTVSSSKIVLLLHTMEGPYIDI